MTLSIDNDVFFVEAQGAASARPNSITLREVLSKELDGLSQELAAQKLSEEQIKGLINQAITEAKTTRATASKPQDPVAKIIREQRSSRRERIHAAIQARKLRAPKKPSNDYWQKLNSAPPLVAKAAIRALDEPETVRWLSQKTITDKTCWSANLSFWLAQENEELFPDQTAIENALELYKKTSLCPEDQELSEKASFRYSMIAIWQNKCEQALPKLLELSRSTQKIYSPRALYWAAHCQDKIGQSNEAAISRTKLLTEHPYSHHAILVAEKNNTDPRTLLSDKQATVIFRTGRLDTDKQVRRIELLLRGEETDLAKRELSQLITTIEDQPNEFLLYVAALAMRSRDYLKTFMAVTEILKRDQGALSPSVLELLYPSPYEQHVNEHCGPLDPLLVTALMRQESAFNPRAHSSAGARGLMQLLPSTARRVMARSHQKLYHPETNIQVGARYLKSLIDRFDGRVDLALASYNAGHLKVENWLKRYPTSDQQLFVELIPYLETREYVSIISRNHYWYRWLARQNNAKSSSSEN